MHHSLGVRCGQQDEVAGVGVIAVRVGVMVFEGVRVASLSGGSEDACQ